MACCLTAPSHYLNQCWLIFSKGQWHSVEGNLTRDSSPFNHYNKLEDYLSKILFKSLRGQWVNSLWPCDAIWRRSTLSSLVDKLMARRSLIAKPSPEPMLSYCQSEHKSKRQGNLSQNIQQDSFQNSTRSLSCWKHDDVIKWKHFPRYWPFVRGIHRLPVNSPHKGQWRGALMFSLIYAWKHVWVNNREAGDLRRHRVNYDIIVMIYQYRSVNKIP